MGIPWGVPRGHGVHGVLPVGAYVIHSARCGQVICRGVCRGAGVSWSAAKCKGFSTYTSWEYPQNQEKKMFGHTEIMNKLTFLLSKFTFEGRFHYGVTRNPQVLFLAPKVEVSGGSWA